MKPSAAASVVVCFAVPEEAAPFQKRLARRNHPSLEVMITGMGETHARDAMLARLRSPQEPPRLVLTCGFAGGLNPALPRGTLLHDTDPHVGLEESLAAAGSLTARFHCATRVAVTTTEKANLRRVTGADAVEMESGIIRQLCRDRGIPSATVRVISDAASEDLPIDFNQLMTPGMRIHFGKLAVVLIRSPGTIRGLLKLRRSTVDAAQRLAALLEIAIDSPPIASTTR